jgi:hypothetical protein
MPAVWGASDLDAAVAELLAEKIRVIDERIAKLQTLKAELQERVSQQCPLSGKKVAGNNLDEPERRNVRLV